MPAPAGATDLNKDITVMDSPFAAPLWSFFFCDQLLFGLDAVNNSMFINEL